MKNLKIKISPIACILCLGLLAFAASIPAGAYAEPDPASGANRLRQQACTLPATVTTADELYECITAANAGAGGTITLGGDIDLTTLTTSPLPQIASAVVLEGGGYAIDGGGSVRFFDVGASGDLAIDQATLRNGDTGSGGGIYNAGGVTVTDSTFSGNVASAFGGGIYNSGTLTVADSTFSGNEAGLGGGAIYNLGGTASVIDSTFSGNSANNAGGGIVNTNGGTFTATNSTFFGNAATVAGGILNDFGATLHLAGNLFDTGSAGTNCSGTGTLNDNGYNLSDDGTCTNGGAGSATNATLNLGALSGGVHTPPDPSDAVAAIPNGTSIDNNGTTLACNGTTTDQLGSTRPINSGDACTSGAVEVRPNSLTIVKDADPSDGTDFDFIYNQQPLSMPYSDSTSGGPLWTRPNEGTTCTLSSNTVNYHVQPFAIDTSGTYFVVSQQNYDGYIHLYQDGFDPGSPCTNYLNGDNDALFSTSSELSHALEAGRIYYVITSGNLAGNTGSFNNTISGPGTVYAFDLAFTLDDADPDDSDSVNGSITFSNLPIGTHTFTEYVPDNWNLTGAVCTGGSDSGTLSGDTLSVALGAGENVTCTVTNEFTCANIVTENQLAGCITDANSNGAGLDTLTLGADINLTSALPEISSAITVEGAGYAIDGGDSVQIFYVLPTGDLTINQATLQNGAADFGGAISNYGTVTVTNSTFSGNSANVDGGAIETAGTVTVTNSTFSDNSAVNGGAIVNYLDTVTVTNSTFSGNSATSGAAIYNDIAGITHLSGSIFAASVGADNCFNNGGTLNDNGYNLSDDASCGFTDTGSVNNATLNLGALSGGVHTPQTGSDAIGAIPNGTSINNNGVTLACNSTTTDQLGSTRPINAGTACTSGAVEVELQFCPSWTVTTADELYECITKANINGAGLDTITLGANINLTSALPPITSTIVVEGADYAIDGGDSVRIFNVGSSGDLTVNQATLQNGYSATDGGGIQNNGTLTVSNSTFSGNDDRSGGGIYNGSGTVTVTNSTFSGNTALNSGGGIYNLSGTVTVTNSTLSGNYTDTYGGAIYNRIGTVTVTNSTFSGNTALNSGGGILIDGGTLTVTNITFSGNSGLISAIYNYGQLASSTVYAAGNIFAASSRDNCSSFSGGFGATFIDNGYNLSGDETCTNGGTGSATNATLNLGALSGGVHTPQTGSDAIGAIPNGTSINNNGVTLACNGTTSDQLGADRPINIGTACTSGAVEVAMPPICTSWTVTTADELYECITKANINGAGLDTITLGADIDLPTLTTSPLPEISSAITVEGAGYAIDGGESVQIFKVGASGNLTVNQATLQNGYSATDGGGIQNNGTLTVSNSTFSGNDTDLSGGGIFSNGTLAVSNSTFSSNDSAIFHSGYNSGTATVWNSTISGNFIGIVYTYDGLTLQNTIIANNADDCFNAFGGVLTANSFNLDSDGSCDSATTADPLLGPLADNGGPTFTMLPGNSSPAIDTGDDSVCAAAPVNNLDQRGIARPQRNQCDIGAVEVEPLCPSWTVTTADELYNCITEANTNGAGSDTITLGANIDLLTLGTSPLPQITSTIVVEGADYAVDGGSSMRIFDVGSSGDLTVNQATLQNGSTNQSGGGIINAGTVTVTDSTIANNAVLVPSGFSNGGGGIYNAGTLVMTNSTIADNSVLGDSGGTDGGGIYNDFGTLTVTNSTFSGNSAVTNGGGIYNYSGTVALSNSTFSGNNAATSSGGSIYSNDGGTMHLAGNIFEAGASGSNCVNADGTWNDNGYNLSDDATCTDGGTGSATNAALNLGALSGGAHTPPEGSDAVGAIPNGTTIVNNSVSWTCDQTFADQPGNARPINAGDDCTAGAVEVVPPPCPTWTVATANELYKCIVLANANESPSPTADIITLGANIDLTTLATSPLPTITTGITLEGAGYALDGGDSVGIFHVGSTGDFTVNRATLQNGSATISGGGIENYGTVTVTRSTLSGNAAASGGGIYNEGTLTVTSSTLSGNAASDGGGIENEGGTLTVTNSTFSGNSAPGNGGGIVNWGGGRLHLAGNIFEAGASGENCINYGTFNDNGYNLSDDDHCVSGGDGSATNAALNLGALSGGVHMPVDPSDAIGAIPNDTIIVNNAVSWTCDRTFTDQLGNTRPISDGYDCTGGAVEYIDLCSAIASGDWTDSGIWSCRLVPTDTIVAVVADEQVVTINSSSTDNRAGTLMIVSGGVLQIQGGLTVGQGM